LLIVIAIFCVGFGFYFVRWNFANAIATRLDLKRPESRPVVDWLVNAGPSDPQTHYAAASLYEKTFDPGDLERSLKEYETATGLSPHNYLLWISLGRIRNLNGDVEGANAALRRSLELAPNYAAVQWAYGNLLLREGKTGEGFGLIARAAETNPEYARTAATIALELLEADVSKVREALGDTQTTNSSLTAIFSSQKRLEEAVESWSRLPAAEKLDKFKPLGESLVGQLAEEKKFRLAAAVVADMRPEADDKPAIGQISMGGFEKGISLRGAGLFEWQIGEGPEPQIGLSDSQKRSGRYGLFILFNSFEASQFRNISQTVAVVPGAEYEFDGFYRSDLKAAGLLKIEIADAAAGAIIGDAPLVLAGDWTTLKIRFAVPANSDGIIIRLAREGCAGPACRIAGRLAFDDFSITRQ